MQVASTDRSHQFSNVLAYAEKKAEQPEHLRSLKFVFLKSRRTLLGFRLTNQVIWLPVGTMFAGDQAGKRPQLGFCLLFDTLLNATLLLWLE